MRALHALPSGYWPTARPLRRYRPAPEYRVHPLLYVILGSGLFWALVIAGLVAIFG